MCMKIALPNGRIVPIDKVVPMVEKRFEYNGETRRLCEEAKRVEDANAVSFQFKFENRHIGANNALFVGNLPNADVRNIIMELTESNNGGYDFSNMHFQEKKPYVLGDSAFPYYVKLSEPFDIVFNGECGMLPATNGFSSPDFAPEGEWDDGDDEEEGDDEEDDYHEKKGDQAGLIPDGVGKYEMRRRAQKDAEALARINSNCASGHFNPPSSEVDEDNEEWNEPDWDNEPED